MLGANQERGSTISGGARGQQRTPEEGEKVPTWLLRPRARAPNRSTAYLQWIVAPWALAPCKNAGIRAAAESLVNMQSSASGPHLAFLCWPLCGSHASPLLPFWWLWRGLLGLRRLPHDESGSIVNMQRSARGRTFSVPCRLGLMTRRNPSRQVVDNAPLVGAV